MRVLPRLHSPGENHRCLFHARAIILLVALLLRDEKRKAWATLTGSPSSCCSPGRAAAPPGSGSTAPARERLRPGKACGERPGPAPGRRPAATGHGTCAVRRGCRRQTPPARPGSGAPLSSRKSTAQQTRCKETDQRQRSL